MHTSGILNCIPKDCGKFKANSRTCLIQWRFKKSILSKPVLETYHIFTQISIVSNSATAPAEFETPLCQLSIVER